MNILSSLGAVCLSKSRNITKELVRFMAVRDIFDQSAKYKTWWGQSRALTALSQTLKLAPPSLILLLGLLCFIPFVLLIRGAWEADTEVLKTLFSSVLLRYGLNTILLCICVLLASLSIGVSTAWLVAQYEFPLRRIFMVLLPLSIIISPYMRGVVFMEYANSLQFLSFSTLTRYLPKSAAFITRWWNFPFLVLTLTLSLFPYVYVFASTLYTKSSRSVIDAARLLSNGKRSLFFSVGLPIAGPALRLGAAVVLMDTLNEYGAISYFGFPTISSAVFRTWFIYRDIGSAKFLASLVLILVLILVACFHNKDKKLRYDINQYYPVNREKLAWQRGLGLGIFCTIWVFLGFILPVYHFIAWAFKAWDASSSTQLWQQSLDTLSFVGIAIFISTVIAILLCYLYHLRQKRLYQVVFQQMSMGYAIPSTIIAIAVLGLVYFLVDLVGAASSQLAGLLVGRTLVALIFAAMLRFFFIMARPIYQGFHQYGQRYEDASRTLGASPWRSFSRIALPLNTPFIFSGILLLLIGLLKEIPLTLVLRPFNFNTLAIRAYLLARDEMLQASAIPTLIIIGLGLIAILLLQWIENRWKPA